MAERTAARKINLEKAQIRSILNDYRKVKQKCISLAAAMGDTFERSHYDAVEKEVAMKMELLGLNQLLQIKENLVNTLSGLFDLEIDLNTKKQRVEARNSLSGIGGSSRDFGLKGSTLAHEVQRDSNQKIAPSCGDDLQVKSKLQSFNVPVYRVKEDSNENKVDRLSKFVASLKRNMKQHCNGEGEKKIKEMLEEETEFLKIKEQLQRYKMREEDLLAIIDARVQRGIQDAIQNASLIEETSQYKIIKMIKAGKNIERTADESSLSSQCDTKKIGKERSKAEGSRTESAEGREETEDGGREGVEVQRKESKIEEAMEKINQTMGVSETRLKELREQRKRIFLDEDVWNEFEQI